MKGQSTVGALAVTKGLVRQVEGLVGKIPTTLYGLFAQLNWRIWSNCSPRPSNLEAHLCNSCFLEGDGGRGGNYVTDSACKKSCFLCINLNNHFYRKLKDLGGKGCGWEASTGAFPLDPTGRLLSPRRHLFAPSEKFSRYAT